MNDAGRRIQIMCAAGLVSGKEIVTLTLAKGLRERGWDVQFITSSWCAPEFIRRLEAEKFVYRQLRIGFISASLRIDPLLMTLDQLRYWPQLASRYRKLIARTSPAVVLYTNWHHALLLLSFLRPERDVYWAHEYGPVGGRQAWAFRKICSRVGRVVCVSKAVVEKIEVAGVPAGNLTVVHNGVDTSADAPPLSPGKPLRLGIIGQVAPWKGHEDVLAAVALLSRKGVDVVLNIFGKGNEDYVRLLGSKASELRISDRVHWRGFVNEHGKIFSEIDVCLSPSRIDEAFGMSVLEAASFGRPVICSSHGGLAEIVQHGVTGLLVEPGQPSRLAVAIETLVRNPDLLRDMGKAARRRAQTEFSIAHLVDGFIDVFEDVQSRSHDISVQPSQRADKGRSIY
jgi:glycosyltransferase involved in cell wall biosynthesis